VPAKPGMGDRFVSIWMAAEELGAYPRLVLGLAVHLGLLIRTKATDRGTFRYLLRSEMPVLKPHVEAHLNRLRASQLPVRMARREAARDRRGVG
jgi:hypothetical protein